MLKKTSESKNFDQKQKFEPPLSQENSKPMAEKTSRNLQIEPRMVTNASNKHSPQPCSSLEADSSILFTKRACSPRPRHKKNHNTPSARLRDKSGSKTKKSKSGSKMKKAGAYYKRCRKSKRSKYDNSEDIKNDIDDWEELVYTNACSENEEDTNNVTEGIDVIDFQKEMSPVVDEDDMQLKRTWWIAFARDKAVKKREFKNLTSNKKKNEWTEVNGHLVVPSVYNGCEVESMELLSNRSRLMSDNSDNSEFSFSIEFTTECDMDADSDDGSDSDESVIPADSTESETESDDEDYVVFSTDMETEDKEIESDSDEDMLSVDCTDCVKSPGPSRPVRSYKVNCNFLLHSNF